MKIIVSLIRIGIDSSRGNNINRCSICKILIVNRIRPQRQIQNQTIIQNKRLIRFQILIRKNQLWKNKCIQKKLENLITIDLIKQKIPGTFQIINCCIKHHQEMPRKNKRMDQLAIRLNRNPAPIFINKQISKILSASMRTIR